jgi:cobalt-zinc-cadmium resistance protein CzcA
VAEAQKMIAASQGGVKIPAGYYLVWGGQFENQQRAMARLYIVVPLVILLIFVLLFSSFNSLRNASLIILNIPFSMIGGIVALYFSGFNLSVSASVGFIALFGVAVLNGIVMVSYFNKLRQEGMELNEAIRKGAELRLRPVLMTALVAALGLLPMVFASGIGAEIQKPLAIVVIGGLISSTLLTLIVLPALYGWFEKEQVEF